MGDNLEYRNILIYMWPQFSVKVPALCTKSLEVTPLWRVVPPWIFAYFTSYIQTCRENEVTTNNIWQIAVQEFEILKWRHFSTGVY